MAKKKDRIICTCDFETDPFKKGRVPKVFGAGFYDGTKYYEWFGDKNKAVEGLIEFIEDMDPQYRERLLIYMHNGGGFDFNYLIKYMDTNLTVLHGDIVKMKIKGAEFRDSLLLLPMSLDKYKKQQIDYALFEKEERWKPENFERIREYQKLDVIYLHEWVSKFIDQFGIQLTLPSASFSEIKKSGIKIERTNLHYDQQYRPYYYGGRTEVRKAGRHKGDMYYYDINSAYPEVMLMNHPYDRDFIIRDELPDSGVYFARIRAISGGALPYREEDGSLRFPADDQEREYFVSSWEIEAGLETGTLEITDVLSVYQHYKTRNFQPFIDKWYGIKLEAEKAGDTDMRSFAKLIMNGGYGKYALNALLYKKYCLTVQGLLPPELVNWYKHYDVKNIRELHEAIVYDDDIEDWEADARELVTTWEPLRDLDGFTIWQRADPSNRFYNTATAASITGAVRAKLWRTICASEGVVYCDTDSVMCRGFKGPISDKLGDWSLECVFDDLYIGGKKLYAGHIKDAPYMSERMFDRMKEWKQKKYLKKAWKKASKGSQLNPYQIRDIVKHKKQVKWEPDAPSFSLRHGARFIERIIQMTV